MRYLIKMKLLKRIKKVVDNKILLTEIKLGIRSVKGIITSLKDELTITNANLAALVNKRRDLKAKIADYRDFLKLLKEEL